MRRLLLALALMSCGNAKASGPKWPEPSKTAEDGGESIEPRPSATYAVVAEKAAEPEEAKPAAATAEAKAAPAASDGKPATTPTTTAPAEEVITTEEIIIEIDD
jgi:hypothetical protein